MYRLVPHAAVFKGFGQAFIHHIAITAVLCIDAMAVDEFHPTDLPVAGIDDPVAIQIDVVGIQSVAVVIIPYRVVITDNGHGMGSRRVPGCHHMFTAFGSGIVQYFGVPGDVGIEAGHTAVRLFSHMVVQPVFQRQDAIRCPGVNTVKVFDPVVHAAMIYIITVYPPAAIIVHPAVFWHSHATGCFQHFYAVKVADTVPSVTTIHEIECEVGGVLVA